MLRQAKFSTINIKYTHFEKNQAEVMYWVSQKKWAPTNGVASNKFCFKEGSYTGII